MGKIRQAGLHAILLTIVIPAMLYLVAAALGGILSTIEGWSFVDGMLYIGGDMVLITLMPEVPTSRTGIVLDFFFSCLALGFLSWILGIVGILPVCDHIVTGLGGKRASKLAAFISLSAVFLLALPAVVCTMAAIQALLLNAANGGSYLTSFELVAGTFSHAVGLATPSGHHNSTTAGKFVGLYGAFLSVGVIIGVTVGVYLLHPIVPSMTGLVGRARGFGMAFIHFVLFVGLCIPIFVYVLAAVFGAVLAVIEDWPSTLDGILYVAGSLVLLSLTSITPTTVVGKIFDFIVSCLGVGVFGLVVAIVGALPFVDKLCEKLGGKSERLIVANGFTLIFFLGLMPTMCLGMAVPLGALLAVGEDWSFADGFFFAASVLVQAPGLAPTGAVTRSTGGKLLLVLCAVYSICTTIGLGAGLIVASSSLDKLSRVILPFLKDVAKDAEGAGPGYRSSKPIVISTPSGEEFVVQNAVSNTIVKSPSGGEFIIQSSTSQRFSDHSLTLEKPGLKTVNFEDEETSPEARMDKQLRDAEAEAERRKGFVLGSTSDWSRFARMGPKDTVLV